MPCDDVRVVPAMAVPTEAEDCRPYFFSEPGLNMPPMEVDEDEIGGLRDEVRGDRVFVARLFRASGPVCVAFRGPAYLLSDSGKTIETIR